MNIKEFRKAILPKANSSVGRVVSVNGDNITVATSNGVVVMKKIGEGVNTKVGSTVKVDGKVILGIYSSPTSLPIFYV